MPAPQPPATTSACEAAAAVDGPITARQMLQVQAKPIKKGKHQKVSPISSHRVTDWTTAQPPSPRLHRQAASPPLLPRAETSVEEQTDDAGEAAATPARVKAEVWSAAEDKQLHQIVEQSGTGMWDAKALHFSTERSGSSLRHRWKLLHRPPVEGVHEEEAAEAMTTWTHAAAAAAAAVSDPDVQSSASSLPGGASSSSSGGPDFQCSSSVFEPAEDGLSSLVRRVVLAGRLPVLLSFRLVATAQAATTNWNMYSESMRFMRTPEAITGAVLAGNTPICWHHGACVVRRPEWSAVCAA